MRRLSFVLLGSLAALATAQAREPVGRIDVPVMVGGTGEVDGCTSVGQIVGLDPNGDGFLSVRSGPGGKPYREIDRLYNGNRVFVCDDKGPWLAVVYGARPMARAASARPGPFANPIPDPAASAGSTPGTSRSLPDNRTSLLEGIRV